MTGYVRQSAASIVNTNAIDASHFNNEYNALVTAFSATIGHQHNGDVGEGAPITVIGPAQEFVASGASFSPKTTNTYSIGTTSLRYSSGWFQGVVTAAGGFAGALTGNVTGDVTGNLTGNVTGDVTGNLTGNVTGNVTGAVTGNASTATALQTSRTISLSGDATGSVGFDGTSNVTISTTLVNTGVSASSYGSIAAIPSITVDSKGRITAASTSAITSIGQDLLQAADAEAAAALLFPYTSRMVVLQSATASSSSVIDLTTGLDDTYDRFEIEFNNLVPATDNAGLILRVGTGGGPTYAAGASDYTTSAWLVGTSSGVFLGGASSSIFLTGQATNLGVGNASGEFVSGIIEFDNPEATKYAAFNFRTRYITPIGPFISVTGGGCYNTSSAITGIRLLFSTGNIASGTVRLIGYKK